MYGSGRHTNKLFILKCRTVLSKHCFILSSCLSLNKCTIEMLFKCTVKIPFNAVL